jgi:hypothetical protein
MPYRSAEDAGVEAQQMRVGEDATQFLEKTTLADVADDPTGAQFPPGRSKPLGVDIYEKDVIAARDQRGRERPSDATGCTSNQCTLSLH